MKPLLCLIALVLCLVRANATPITLSGDLTWEITEPRCTFKLDGELQNNSAAGSGTLKLVLWATQGPFPSPGVIVGEYTLGQIESGSQFSDFTVRATSKVPSITGDYYFTIAVVEDTGANPKNVLAVPTGTKSLQLGNFTSQLKWTLPTATVLAPPAKIIAGNVLTLNSRATDLLNLFPASSQLATTLSVKSKTKLIARNSFGKRTPSYKYAVVKTTFNKKKVSAGKLTLTYPASGNKAKTAIVATLYFQTATSGTFKSVETNSSGSETTWGDFSTR